MKERVGFSRSKEFDRESQAGEAKEKGVCSIHLFW
jgi:hypothetical protein